MKKPTQLKLISLRLKNFMQDRESVIVPNGADLVISGANGAGKSTKASALMWLLFGLNIRGEQLGPDIKTTDTNPASPTFGQPIHRLEHEAEAEFDLGGDTITLKGRYTEKWERPSGADKDQCTGHTTAWFVDGIPKSQREYQDVIASICPRKWLRLLIDPTYFFGLKAEDQRAILMEICGDFTDAEVVASSMELANLPKILGRHTVADYRKKIEAERKPLIAERAKIPTKIATIHEGMTAEIPGDHASELALRRQRLEGLQQRKAEATKSGNLIELRNEVKRLEGEMQAVETRLKLVGDPARDKALADQSRLKREIADAQFKAKNLETKIRTNEVDIERWETKLTGLRAEKAQIKVDIEAIMAEGFDGELNCTYCGAELSEEKAAEVLAKFNTDRAQRHEKKQRELDANNTEGKSLKGRVEKAQTELDAWRNELSAATAQLAELEAQAARIVVPEASVVDHTQHPAWISWKKLRDEKLAQIAAEEGGDSGVLAGIDADIKRVQDLIEEAVRAQQVNEARARDQERIEALEAEEKRIGAEIERLDYEAHLCETFVVAKARLLTERINSRFQFCQFTLFMPNITNEGIQEVCELTFRGAPPSNGEAILCGLDMHNAVADYLGFEAFVIVDNAESFTGALATRGQQIRLRATEDVEELTVRTIDRADKREVLFA